MTWWKVAVLILLLSYGLCSASISKERRSVRCSLMNNCTICVVEFPALNYLMGVIDRQHTVSISISPTSTTSTNGAVWTAFRARVVGDHDCFRVWPPHGHLRQSHKRVVSRLHLSWRCAHLSDAALRLQLIAEATGGTHCVLFQASESSKEVVESATFMTPRGLHGNMISRPSLNLQLDIADERLEVDFDGQIKQKPDTAGSTFFRKRLRLIHQRDGQRKVSRGRESESLSRSRRSNNANSPQFEHGSYKFSVEENKDPGTLVGVVTATDADVGLAGQLTYSMTATKDTRSNAMFLINHKSGQILTKQKLDRELLGKHEFTLTVKDKGSPVSTDTAKLVITVLDENDNSPAFEQTSYSREIPEDVATQTTVTTVHAIDRDSGANGTIVYSLSSTGNTNNAFAIDPSSGDIITMKTLDRETVDHYDLTAIATDGGRDNRSASVAVSITLSDVNDSPPKFDKNLYQLKVAEDVAVQTTILTVTATSADLGTNALVSYSMRGNSDGRLTIDSTSGDIIVTKELDYEKVTFYRLTIQAQDGGVSPLTTTTKVDVQVDNVNDNSPIFQSETVYVIDIAENIAKNSPVTQVTAIDNDKGTFGKVTYRITSSDVLDTFTIGSTTGSITTLKELDYEADPSYTINVVAEDGGNPPESGQVTIIVSVKDINDESPQFVKKEYRKSVSESADIGTGVLHVSATDSDFPSGGRLTYSIKAGDFGIPFSISSYTGRVRVSSNLDHEVKDMYNFVVMATDGELSNTTEVRIKVLDENDSPPVFKGLPSTVSVPENVDIGTLVYTVTATDSDSGNNSRITFSLEDDFGVFAIDPSSGEVTTLRVLDYENITFARLRVVATDGGNPPMQTRTHLSINILDENDNTPVFTTLPHHQGAIMENAVIGTMVLTVSATDKDKENGYPLTYSFVENVTAFQISPTSGLIRTATILDRESVAEYRLEVQAVDSGELPRTGKTTVLIEVLDISDNPPEFEKQSYAVSIYESKEPGSEIIQVKAISRDSSVDDADIQYSIQEGDEEGTFRIDPQTGSIELAKQVDAENTPQFLLRVQATAGFHFANVFVAVTVLDLNDNPPLVEPLSIHVNILEGSFDHQVVGRVRARDPDSTSILVQGLAEKLPSPFLEFNNRTGSILVKPGISEGTYVLNTSVSDGVTTVSGVTHVIVRMISKKAVNDSVILRVVGSTLLSLVDHYHDKIIQSVAKYIGTSEDLIDVYSIQYSTDHSDHFDILLAVRSRDGGYVPRMVVISQIDKHIVDIEKDMGFGIDNVNVDMCLREPCSNFQDCSNELTVDNSLEKISATSVVFHSIHHKLSFSCHCPSGFVHSWDPNGCVEQLNNCLSNPCINGGSCVNLFDGYRCVCINGTAGDQCELVCPSESCNMCDPNPCFNGGSCRVINGVQIKCSCLSGFDGPNCEQTSAHFGFGSWLAFPSLSFRWYFVISFEFATVEQNGLLLFNDRLGPEYDFIAAEIIGGQLVGLISFGGGTVKVTAQSQMSLADGQWHSVVVSVKNRELTVTVEDCEGPNMGSQPTVGVQYSSVCSASGQPSGKTRSLDLDSYFYLGGFEMKDFTYPITTTQFSGCMRNIRINDNLLDLSKATQNVRVSSGCPPTVPACTSNPCQNSGVCQNVWNGFYCSCSLGFGDQHCETDLVSSQLSGNGYVHYRLIQEVFLFKFGIAFRTRQTDATLFQTERSLLQIERGYLHLTFNVSSVTHSLFLTNGTVVNDGLWHDVTVTTLSGTTLSLDYGRYITTLPNVVTASSRNFYVGGKHIHPRTVVDNLVGCIRGIEVNNQFLQSDHSNVTLLNNGRTVGVTVTSVGVSTGCHSADVCSSNPCPANSQCIDEWEAYSCECNSGQRPLCVSACEPQPCLNNGQCVFDSKSNTGFICQCQFPYTGQLCELPKKCQLGFYDYPSCRPCLCNREGALDTICDQKTGECLCKEQTFSPVGRLECQPCDCDVVGSVDSKCDDTGQCECRQFVTGRKCDRCLPGYEGLSDSGCHEAVYVNGALVLPKSSFWSFLTQNSTKEHQLLSTQLKQDIQTVFTGLHGTQTAVITEFRKSTSNAVQALFRVASYDSSDGRNTAPTINEVISVLNTVVARGKLGQRSVEQLEISAVCAEEPCFPGVVCLDVNGGFQCGACPARYSGDGIMCIRLELLCKDSGNEVAFDIDNDGILDACDNCQFEFNPEQPDSNGNGVGDICESTSGICRSVNTNSIHWPVTESGQTALLPCPSGQEGLVIRKCHNGEWEPAVFANCLSNMAMKLQQQRYELENGRVLQPSESEAFASLLRDVSQGVVESDEANGDAVIAIDILVKLIEYVTALAQHETIDTMTRETIPQLLLEASSYLLTSGVSHWEKLNQNDSMAGVATLTKLLEDMGTAIAASQVVHNGAQPESVIAEDNIVMQLFSVSGRPGADVFFPTSLVPLGSFARTYPTGVAVSIPSSVFAETGSAGISIISYRNLMEFLPKAFGNINDGSDMAWTTNSGIMSVAISSDDIDTNSLSSPVKLIFTHKQSENKSTPMCAFWNFSGIGSSEGEWSTSGCSVSSNNATHTVCKCNHLSTFTILMSGGHIELDVFIIASGGIGVTLAMLIFFLLIILKLRHERIVIIVNFLVAFIASEIFFIVGIGQESEATCKAMAVLMHFFFTAVFAWFAIDLYSLHHTSGRHQGDRSRIPLYCSIGWGLPLLIVILCGGIRFDGYMTDFYCWLDVHDVIIWGFGGPALLAIAVVLIMYFVTCDTIIKRKRMEESDDIVSLASLASVVVKFYTVTAPCLVLTFVFGYLFLYENGRKWETAFGACNLLMGVFVSISYLVQVLKLSHKLGTGKSGRYDLPAITPSKSILSTSTNRDIRPARSVSFPESEQRSNRYAVTGGFIDEHGSWSDVMHTIDEDCETREPPGDIQSDDDIGSDSPPRVVSLARIRRAQGDGADSDHAVHKPYNEVDSSNDPQYGSHTISIAEQRQRTVDQVLAGVDERAWYEEEDENYEKIPVESLARHQRPEGLSPSVDASNDDESLQNHYAVNNSLYPRVEVVDDNHGWKSQPIEWPLDCKDLDDSSSESSSDSEGKPVQHHRRDSNRARYHRGRGHHSQSRHRRHHLSSHKHHRHHHGHRSKTASGLDGRRYLRPQFSPVEQQESFEVSNPVYSSVSVSSIQSDDSKVYDVRKLPTRALHRRSSGELEHQGSRSRSQSVESRTVTGEFLRKYKTPRFDSPVGTMPTSLGTIYQQPQRETSFGASPPPNDSHIRFVHGFDLPKTQKEPQAGESAVQVEVESTEV